MDITSYLMLVHRTWAIARWVCCSVKQRQESLNKRYCRLVYATVIMILTEKNNITILIIVLIYISFMDNGISRIRPNEVCKYNLLFTRLVRHNPLHILLNSIIYCDLYFGIH